jgi:hypothetical protein
MPGFLEPRSAHLSCFQIRFSREKLSALVVAIAFGVGCSSSGSSGSAGAAIVAAPKAGASASGSSGGTAVGSAGTSSGQLGVGVSGSSASAQAGTLASGGTGATAAIGVSGASGASAGAGGVSGASAGAGGGVSGTGGATVVADAGVAGAGGTSASSTGTFPAIMDPNTMGPYATSTKTGAGPKGDGTVYYPTAFGPDGLKNPIFVWDPGSGISGTMYATLLTHLASHGFAAYACSASSATGSEVKDGIDWMIAQNTASGSIFNGKLDTTKVAAGGHSLGSIATFANATDVRLTTTIHVSGGTMDSSHAAIATLKYPVLYVCGETCTGSQTGLTDCDLAAPNCTADYGVTKVPVFYGQNTTASHAFGWQMDYGALTAWLRWYLMGDTSQKPEFLGSDCVLCKTPWVGMSKGLQ